MVLSRDIATELLFHSPPGHLRIIYNVPVMCADAMYHVHRLCVNVVRVEVKEGLFRQLGHILLTILLLQFYIDLARREHDE